jgi:Fe-S cluster biogenesis protein NfuA
MAAASEDHELRRRMHRIDDLLKEIDRFKDPQARARTRQIVQALMEYHGAAIEKLMETVASAGAPGLGIIDAMARDDAVASLLLLYGLHPLDLETRVQQALEKTRPYLHSHGGNVELLAVADGVVRLRLDGSCHGCPSSAQTLQQTIEEAILETAPDVTAIEVVDERVTVPAAPSAPDEPGRFALPILSAK